jgi:hypothetical protein
MKLIMQVSPVSICFILLRSKYSHQRPVLRHWILYFCCLNK